MACISNMMVRPCVFSASRVHLFHRQAQAAALCILHRSRPLVSRSSSSFSTVGVQFSRVNGGEWTRSSTLGLGLGLGLGGRNRFSVGASHVNDAGSIDSPLMQSMEKKIKEQLSAESVIVKDAYGDGRHVSIDVVASSFEGQSAVNRQRMVYKAIWEELQNTVHAVDQMTTRTPAEAAGEK